MQTYCPLFAAVIFLPIHHHAVHSIIQAVYYSTKTTEVYTPIPGNCKQTGEEPRTPRRNPQMPWVSGS